MTDLQALVPGATIRAFPDETSWAADGATCLGASEVAAALGLSPWATPLEVWASKSRIEVVSDDTDAMRFGRLLEAIVCEEYARRTGRAIHDPGRWTRLRHREHPWCSATLDRIILPPVDGRDGPGVLEAKTASARLADEWEGGPPDHYVLQLQWQLWVTGLRWGALACLIGGQRWAHYDVTRDDELIAGMVERARAFWGLVERGTPPLAESGADMAVLRAIYPREVAGHIVDLGPEADALDREVREAEAALAETRSRLEPVIETGKARMASLIGGAEAARLPSGVVWRWATEARKAYSVPASERRVIRRREPPRSKR